VADTAAQTEGGAGQNRPQDLHYCEGLARLRLGGGFFRPQSRPSRDLGVLLARCRPQPLEVLDLMAGCGIRGLRYGLEAGASAVWLNDADGDRLPLMQANLAPLADAGCAVRTTALTAQKLLAECLLHLASTEGRSPTGHDRAAALRSLGAAARAHPASWELALRLQIGVVARAAWALGRGVRPLFSFSEGRTFRVALELQRRADPQQERLLGLLAHCHGCGEQFSQGLWKLRQWPACGCGAQAPPLAISGPLWLGPLQHAPTLEAMAERAAAAPPGAVAPASLRLLRRLLADPGLPERCWPMAELGRRLGGGPPATEALLAALQAEGFTALRSGVMDGQFRCNAPWSRVLELAAALNR
jgi:tRNA (guanine26-N2/guanine27-N2)-dimethyltransferase